MSRGTPPQSDEFEVSVFGPGRGECILVHMGYNEWCMIDSCIESGKSLPAAVEYLKGLGQATLDGVLLVLATHWHDDHIGGMAACLLEFTNAQFACSNAPSAAQFLTLVQLQTKSLQGNSGVDEFAKILQLLKERKRHQVRSERVTPILAMQDRRLLHRSDTGRAFSSTITALSPSDASVKLALNKIANLVPQANQLQRRITNRPPNEASVVLMVEVGGRKALLGADLEHSGHKDEGWLAILNSSQTPVHPAKVFKVPHHGSRSADCPEVWQKLLDAEPVAIVTPFTSGQGLPQEKDIERLQSRTPSVYCTAVPKVRLPKRDNKVVQKKLDRRKRIAIDGRMGHVRVRWSISDATAAPQIELFDGAFKALPNSA
jgi:beta-lactamase superfamily II metal-dependent hydrolase